MLLLLFFYFFIFFFFIAPIVQLVHQLYNLWFYSSVNSAACIPYRQRRHSLGYLAINFYPASLSTYLSRSLGDRRGTTRSGNQHLPFLSFLCSPHGVAQFQTRPISDVIFPSFSRSASPSPSPPLEDCLGKPRSIVIQKLYYSVIF